MSIEDNHACGSNLDNRANHSFDGGSPQRRSSDANAEDLSESPLPPPDLTEDDDDDDDDDFPSVMTASYSEICFDQDEDDADLLPGEIVDLAEVQDATMGLTELVEQLNREEGLEDPRRPQSLPLREDGKGPSKSHRAQQTSCSQATSPGSLMSSEDILEGQELQKRRGSAASGLSDLQGTLTFDGDMVNFVAEDLHEKIKLSSPIARKSDAGSFPGSRSSTPSLYKQALQPGPVGLIDPAVLADLESQARAVATSVDTLLENLGSSLHGISSLTIDCVRLYENSMCKTCDSVDANIKTMYQLMVKYEELSKSMRPLYSIAGEVKNIKKLLEHFENVVEGKT